MLSPEGVVFRAWHTSLHARNLKKMSELQEKVPEPLCLSFFHSTGMKFCPIFLISFSLWSNLATKQAYEFSKCRVQLLWSYGSLGEIWLNNYYRYEFLPNSFDFFFSLWSRLATKSAYEFSKCRVYLLWSYGSLGGICLNNYYRYEFLPDSFDFFLLQSILATK